MARDPATLEAVFQAIRGKLGEARWTGGVRLANAGSVLIVRDTGDEIEARVKEPARPTPHEVFLWPNDVDWGCDCRNDGVCPHVAAAVLAARKGASAPPVEVEAPRAAQRQGGQPTSSSPASTPVGSGGATPASPARGRASPSAVPAIFQVKVAYQFVEQGDQLVLKRWVQHPDGRQEPLIGTLADRNLVAERGDLQVEALLVQTQTDNKPMEPDLLRKVLQFLEDGRRVKLDQREVVVRTKPVLFRVRVSDHGEGFRLKLVRPQEIDRLFRGAALVGQALHPTSHGELRPEQRKMLIQGTDFGPSEVGTLVSEMIPRLRERIPVDVETQRLPGREHLRPRIRMLLEERPGGLQVRSELVYGDPVVAVISASGAMRTLSDSVVVARDLVAERTVAQTFRNQTGRPAGYGFLLAPVEAMRFLTEILPRVDAQVDNQVDPARFTVASESLEVQVQVQQVSERPGANDSGAWSLDVAFRTPSGQQADARLALEAWQRGRSVVPLLDGGFASLPADWMAQHGALLLELFEARDAQGRVERVSTAALVELLDETGGGAPPDLQRLRSFLEGGEGWPDVAPPPGLRADLRPYQLAGFQWLRFLREMGLHGVLADEMGLGKTVQALAALAETRGPHLVVAPTSVLRNWAFEANRFTPDLKVNLYHGASRSLDAPGDLVLTSYAILRLDLELLRKRRWGYAVLDEAQTIKNASSQTARAACLLNAHHRLALTGTPVENRLEELWSLFRYLMPGLLGTETSFRERFARPVEAGDAGARKALRARVRPYVLRRLKQQVAKDLPPFTEIVVRCEMGEAQRRFYETVRLALRKDVQDALAERGGRAAFSILEALLRLRQVCCDPSLVPGGGPDVPGSAKLDRMEELLVEVVTEGHKALVFSQWTSLLDRVEPRLKALGIDFVRLDGSTRDRQAVIDAFQRPDGPPVFLLSLKAGGTGLNLTEADYVLHLDPWWNPAVERQATDRAHRIGQTRPVVSCKLVAEDSVEERILELQLAKKDLAQAAITDEGGFLGGLSADELRGLFDLS